MFNYYKLHDIRNIQYYMMPKSLFEGEYHQKLSLVSKVAYAFLLDRLELSRQNGWADENGVYLIYTRENLATDLGVHVNTLTKVFKELTDMMLIIEKRRGLGQPNIIYVGKIDSALTINVIQEDTIPINVSLNPNECVSEPQELWPNNTNINKNNISKTKEKDMPAARQSTLISLKTEEKVPSVKKVKKKMSHSEISDLHIEQAKSGEISWDKVTDRDFTLFYIKKHNELFSEIVFDRYKSVSVFRDCLVRRYEIERDKICEYVEGLLTAYAAHPKRADYPSLTFNIIANYQSLMNDLMRRVKTEVDPKEKRFSYNEEKTSEAKDLTTETF